MADALMTVEEVAKYLKVEESTVYTWARQRKVPAIKISRFWRFRKEDIDKWLEGRKNETGNVRPPGLMSRRSGEK